MSASATASSLLGPPATAGRSPTGCTADGCASVAPVVLDGHRWCTEHGIIVLNQTPSLLDEL
ncbi:hypothetical protein K6U06_06720 [Acidiferrimicrobium sp. IK]|uniref:hypothetical protein n=1 Tax=Acidiferrimicrobium sp. IK TaxID=2871700 RepID=UPI0021CB7430|nr:hypothetical protein [Acidiferrimicrobium sp. IK]MCU4184047.1 hypothetical protein [Acidiferrimicrobium sp. IK]